MPPPGAVKRKRGDRSYSGDSYSRPSPHRPENLSLAQQSQAHSPGHARESYDGGVRGGRRLSRGARGGAYNSRPVNGASESQGTNNPSSPQITTTTTGLETMATTPKPSILEETLPPTVPKLPYHYTYLTNDVCDAWESDGRDAILTTGRTVLQESDSMKITELLQELIQSSIIGRVKPSAAGEVVGELIKIETDNHMEILELGLVETSILDSISILFENDPSLSLDHLAHFLASTGITTDLLRLELDAALLEKLELIRNTFNRMGIRKQTNLLYRQANFNLMREESEGFAKLMTELFTTSDTEPPSSHVVEGTVEKVKAMIGAFDLDVGRSLDVVLDVFGAVLVKQFRFFVKFLRASPWWPRQNLPGPHTSSLGGLPLWAVPGFADWHLTEEQKHAFSAEARLRDQKFWEQARTEGLQAFYAVGRISAPPESLEKWRSSPDDSSAAQWIAETGTLPAIGNRDAAQLLGFKLRFYSSSAARDESDVLPDNLIYLSALLIKIGFISLEDLYPHIWRSDEEMDQLKQQKLKEKSERERAARPGAGARNALLMAGALADDTLPIPPRLKESSTRAGTPSKESETEKVSTKEAPYESADQKVLLLKSLLAIGALPEALFILGRFPWLIDLYPDLPEYIHRILHHTLSEVYGSLQPLSDRSTLQSQKPGYDTDLPGMQKGQVRLVDIPERKVLRWALLDKNDSNDGTDYRFYWDEWSDNIPVCRSVDDVFTLCDTLLALVGVKIGQDPALVLKLARIGKQSLKSDTSEFNRSRWLDLSKRVLLPALSLTKSNAGVVNEVFELISQYPINTRYLLYLEWSTGKVSRIPDVKIAFDQARAETKDVLKRISKTNVRPMARALAKVAYANPHIVITTAMAQIEVYDSIAEVFVEGARYFTDLGYDVLTWALISSMARAGRSRTQEGGIFTSRWLSALAQFAGKIYRRYSMMKPGPVLQYVAEQLAQGNSTDLKMLEQIVVAMAGIATDTSYNDAQLQAMGGGPLLQSQTILQLLDRRHDSRTTSKRLMKSLQDTNLAGKFLLSMAQQRQACVFEEMDVPLKAIGNTYDEIQRVMVQYLDLLRTNLGVEEFRQLVPSILELLIDYEIRPEIAFWICRPLIAKQMQEADKEIAENRNENDLPPGDVEMSDQINAGSEEDGEAIDTDNAEEDGATPTDAEISGTNLELDSIDKTASLVDSVDEYWHPVMKDLMDAIQPNLPEEVVQLVGVGFYVTFWQLSLYDITIPGKSYEDELSRQHKKIAAISSDRTDVSVSGTKKKDAEKKVINELVDKLLIENKQHLKAFAESKRRLQREKDQWFIGKARMTEQLNTGLMEHCFLPRILSSPLDAYFCFKFVKFLHGAGTPNFRTLGFYDLFFRASRIASLIFMCTSKEADNLGRFLNEVMKDLSRWHGNKSTYEREAWGTKKNLPGFAMKVEGGKVVSLLDFESFRRVLYKWHGHFYTALQKCLTSPEYMHVRNAISVLRAVSLVYPTVNWHGTGLQKSVDKLRDSDKEDLKVSSQALLGALHRREKLWIMPQAFRQGQEKAGEESQSVAPKKEIPQKNAEESSLKNGVQDKIKESTSKPIERQVKEEVRGSPRLSKNDLPESTRPSSRLASSNGVLTPTRSNKEVIPDRKEARMSRADTKTTSSTRRLSPPRHHSSTPNRLEPQDSRGSYRESQRLQPPPRQPPEPRRPTAERGPPSRSNYRGPEPPFDDYERSLRRHDRPDGMSRDDRTYGREHDRGHDRPRPAERENLARSESVRSTEHDARNRREPPPDAQSKQPPKQDTVPINPERAALINSPDSRNQPPPRSQANERSTRSSRPTSPKEEDRRSINRVERDDRQYSDRRSDVPPPRANQPSANRPGSGSHNKDPRPPSQGYVESQQGRLEQDSNHRPLTRNDRQQDSDVPSGPRNRPNMSGPRGRGGPPLNTQTTPAPFERSTPTGPAKHSRNSSTLETPMTPDTSVIHPSRLSQVADATRSQPSMQTSPPQGPKGNAPVNAPSGPSPTTRGPPSGPHMNDSSTRGGRNRNPINTVNTTLAQAGQGTSIRGRGGMRQNVGFNPHVHPQPSIGPRDGLPSQQDLFTSQTRNGGPMSTRPSSNRLDNRKFDGPERDDRRRQDESRDSRDVKDDRESRNSMRREEQPLEDRRGYRPGPRDDVRKHGRGDEGMTYGAGGNNRGGGRMTGETKRPRRGQ